MRFFKKTESLYNVNKKIIIHENPFVVFFVFKDVLYMEFKDNSKKINLNLLLKDFIKKYKESKNQIILNEIEFKSSQIENIIPFSQYNLESIRFAFSKFFFNLSQLVEKKIIEDTDIDFNNKFIENKYEFIFKNLGENLKINKSEDTLLFKFDFSSFSSKELKKIKKIYSEAGINYFKKNKKSKFFKKAKVNKYFKIKKPLKEENKIFYLIRIKPETLRTRFRNDYGKISFKKLFKKNSIFYDIEGDSRFFLITEKNYKHLRDEILSKKDVKTQMFKIHFDPSIYFNNYYELNQILDYKLFNYYLYKLEYNDLRKIKFIKPEKNRTYS